MVLWDKFKTQKQEPQQNTQAQQQPMQQQSLVAPPPSYMMQQQQPYMMPQQGYEVIDRIYKAEKNIEAIAQHIEDIYEEINKLRADYANQPRFIIRAEGVETVKEKTKGE